MRNKLRIVTLVIATILVLTLALGALVACGEKNSDNFGDEAGDDVANGGGSGEIIPDVPGEGDPNTPSVGDGGTGSGSIQDPSEGVDVVDGPMETSAYFEKFNQLSKSLGATKIEKGADLYFHSEMSGTFGLRSEDGAKNDSFELGTEIEAILDRTSQDIDGAYTSERSAIRARLFSGDVDIVALSFFVNDPLSLYVDFAGSHIKLSAEFVYKDNNLNEMLGRFIGKALNKEVHFGFSDAGFDFSLNKLLDAIVEGTGAEWSPTVLLKSLAALIGMGDGDIDASFEEDSDFSLLGSLLAKTFNAQKSGNDYSIILDTRDTNLVVHALFSKLLGLDLLFRMSFTEDDGRLAGGVRFELGIPELLNDEGCYPYVGVCVDLLEMLPVDGKVINMPAALDEYKGNIAFKSETSIGPKGFKLFGSELRDIHYSEAFMLDLIEPLQTNRTAAQVKLSMTNDTLGEDILFELSFVRGRLALRVAPQVIFKEGTLVGDVVSRVIDFVMGKLKQSDPELEAQIADALYVGGANGTRENFNEELNGVVVDNVPVRSVLDSLVESAIDAYASMPELPELPNTDEDTSREEWGTPSLSELRDLLPASIMRQRILPALGEIVDLFTQLEDGKVFVHTDSLLGLALEMANDIAGLKGDERMSQSELFDKFIEGATSILDKLAEMGYVEYSEEIPDALSLMDDMFESLFEVFELKDAPAKLENESFTKYALRLLLGSTSVDMSIDLTDGWRYCVGFGIVGATLNYSRSFTAWEGLEVQDLYDNAENGWILFDFTDLDDFIK